MISIEEAIDRISIMANKAEVEDTALMINPKDIEALYIAYAALTAWGKVKTEIEEKVIFIDAHWQNYHSPSEAKGGYKKSLEIIEQNLDGFFD